MVASSHIRAIDCLDLIEQRLPALTGATRRIAETIVADPWEALGMTIYDLAVASGVSQPSVTRFCRSIGYQGFREVMHGVAQSLGRIDAKESVATVPAAGKTATLREIAGAVASHQAEVIQATLRTLDVDAIEQAAAAIAQAHHVSVVGHGGAYATAMSIAFKLNWSGVYAAASTPDVFCSQAIAIGPHDVVIGVSHQGRTRDTIEVLRLARSFGATTIALSTVAHAPLSSVASISVAVLTPAIARSGTFLVANSTLLYLVEILSIAVTKRMWSGPPPRRAEVVEWIEKMMRVGPLAAPEGKRGRASRSVSKGGANVNGTGKPDNG